MSQKKDKSPKQEAGEISRTRGSHGNEMIAKLPPEIRQEVGALRKHEERILDSLNRDEELKKIFLVDPGAALA